MANISGNVK